MMQLDPARPPLAGFSLAASRMASATAANASRAGKLPDYVEEPNAAYPQSGITKSGVASRANPEWHSWLVQDRGRFSFL